MPRCYLAHAQGELNLRILRMFEGTFSLDTAKIRDNMMECRG